MDLCNNPDIYEEKMSKRMEGLDFAWAYFADLLVVSKDSYENHLNYLEQVLTRLAQFGLKINACKKSFCWN
jgi:hypothetical protein